METCGTKWRFVGEGIEHTCILIKDHGDVCRCICFKEVESSFQIVDVIVGEHEGDTEVIYGDK